MLKSALTEVKKEQNTSNSASFLKMQNKKLTGNNQIIQIIKPTLHQDPYMVQLGAS